MALDAVKQMDVARDPEAHGVEIGQELKPFISQVAARRIASGHCKPILALFLKRREQGHGCGEVCDVLQHLGAIGISVRQGSADGHLQANETACASLLEEDAQNQTGLVDLADLPFVFGRIRHAQRIKSCGF